MSQSPIRIADNREMTYTRKEPLELRNHGGAFWAIAGAR